MRTLLRLLLPLLGFVLTGVMLFGFWQAAAQEERLYDDLQRRAQQVAEGMEPAAHNALLNRNQALAQRLVQSFERRERLQGGIIYGRDGGIVAITPRLAGWPASDTAMLEDIVVGARARERQVAFGENRMHAYLLPVYDQELRLLGAVEVAYTTEYILQAMAETWQRLLLLVLVLASGIIVTVLLVWRRLISRPLARLTDWFRRFQRGERLAGSPQDLAAHDLGSLATEVEQVALNLRIARKSVVQEAQQRLQHDESWTEERLRDLTRARLRGNPPWSYPTANRTCMSLKRPANHPVACGRRAGWLQHSIPSCAPAAGPGSPTGAATPTGSLSMPATNWAYRLKMTAIYSSASG